MQGSGRQSTVENAESQVGERIRQRRLRRFLTQQELAELAGVSKRTVQSVEKGTRPRGSTARALAEALGLTIDELTGDEVAA